MPPAPPWEDEQPQAKEHAAPDFSGAAAQKKTESRAELVHDAAAPAQPSPSKPIEVPAAPKPLAPQAVPALNWDGNWPALAALLPVRGVAQQLAQQSELIQCEVNGEAAQLHLRIPLDTLRSAGSVDKLANALSEHFGKTVRVTTDVGVVAQTANAQAVADRAERQRQAEEIMQSDPFVQTLMREFGATIVPGSIKPV
jgi:DNA polymerase-3 subunit gamma/tau